MKVAFHPERGKLALPNPLATDVNHWLGIGRSGLKLELIGHGSATTVLLPPSHLPYVQLYKKREPGLPCLNPAHEHDRDWSSSTLDHQVAMDLYECTGDTTATTQVLLEYYKRLSRVRKRGSPPAFRSNETEGNEMAMADVGSDNRVSDRIMKEVELPNIGAFQSKVETTYRNAFEDIFTDFSSPVSSLVSSCTITGIYEATKKLFPLCHFVFATAVSTKRDSIAPHSDQCKEGWDGNKEETLELLDRKNKRVLSIFFGLLLSKSQRMLPFFPHR